jgi:hypothetical protein
MMSGFKHALKIEREREREAPVYFKDTYFSGMSTLLKDESTQLFNGYTLKDYFF